MIEILVTSIPFWLRVLYLRWRGMPITLYNLHRALFLWVILALIVFFAVFYYHPKSYSGVVPFRIVPVVAERGGTVTAVMVEVGQRVEPGDVLFTTDDSQELAAVEVARRQLDEIEGAVSSADAQVRAAQAIVDQASAALKQANASLADQEELRSRNSAAFRENEYERLINTLAAREAEVAAATAALETAQLEVTELLPARRESAAAALAQAQIELDHTTVRSSVAGAIEQLTLSVGARAGQTNLGPAMLIVPDGPLQITAGFAQVARSVLHTGMAAEAVCYSTLNVAMTDAVLPARVVRIQNVIATGQIAPTGLLLEPSSVANEGDVVVHFALEYPEHEALLPRGSSCIVQTYTTHLSGPLEGGLVAHAIEAMGIIKAVLLRTKGWAALVVGVGLGGGGSH